MSEISPCLWLDGEARAGPAGRTVDALPKYLGGADRAGAAQPMQALLGMVKLDIAALKQASYDGGQRGSGRQIRADSMIRAQIAA